MVTKQFCHNEGKLILRALFAGLPDVRTVLAGYYLPDGDAVAPSRLYAKLCHAFLDAFSMLSIF